MSGFTKIPFLDIDGVLITSRSRLAAGTYPAFDPVSCSLVQLVCEHCQAGIVICSYWRENRAKEAFQSILEAIGIGSGLLHEDWATPMLDGQREMEITEGTGQSSHYRLHGIFGRKTGRRLHRSSCWPSHRSYRILGMWGIWRKSHIDDHPPVHGSRSGRHQLGFLGFRRHRNKNC